MSLHVRKSGQIDDCVFTSAKKNSAKLSLNSISLKGIPKDADSYEVWQRRQCILSETQNFWPLDLK